MIPDNDSDQVAAAYKQLTGDPLPEPSSAVWISLDRESSLEVR
jgi:hypothetical protein